MLDKLISLVAPHHCCSCGRIGAILCDNCKINIEDERLSICLCCGRPTSSGCLCKKCHVKYQKAWFCGARDGVLQRLIGLYKFERCREAYRPLANILNDTLPYFDKNVVIVPIPTAPPHIRERGYDQMLLIAKRLAKLRNLKVERLLVRETNDKQRQASAKKRKIQAERAFSVSGEIDSSKIYLVIDDVYTTGATINAAVKKMHEAGVKNIWVAVIAKQMLD